MVSGTAASRAGRRDGEGNLQILAGRSAGSLIILHRRDMLLLATNCAIHFSVL